VAPVEPLQRPLKVRILKIGEEKNHRALHHHPIDELGDPAELRRARRAIS
jgi:hypothetical protein